MKLVGQLIIYYGIILAAFDWISKQDKSNEKIEYKFFTANKKSLIVTTSILFICWMPYFLRNFPAIASFDSIFQMKQAVGAVEVTAHHPIIHTFLIKICLNIGMAIFNTINAGVALYTIVQMLIMSFIFAFIIYYMARKNVSFYYRIGTLIYFAFIPTFPMLSVTMWKDVIFSGMFALSTIVFIELLTNTESFFDSKKKLVSSFFILLIMLLFRNNALYCFILTIPFVILILRKYRIKCTILFVSLIMSVFIINYISNNVMKIPKGSEVEKYSVPLQQIARTRIYENERLTEEEKSDIYKFLPRENLEEIYQGFLSDPIKGCFNIKYFREHKMDFFKLWFKLLVRFPGTYIDAFCCNTSGYWYPEEARKSLWDGVYPNELGVESQMIWDSEVVNFGQSIIDARNVPVIGMLFSTSFVFWIILIMYVYNIYNKRYNFSMAFLPIVFCWLTVLLGPLNTEYRYVFYMFICIPLLVVFTINNIDNKKRKENVRIESNIKEKNG